MTGLFEMQEADLITVFAMRNDPGVLSTGIGLSPISWNEHKAFFEYARYPKYVYKVNGEIVGYVDFRPYPKSDDTRITEWGFNIAPWARSKGYALPMLSDALKLAEGKYIKIIGRIIPWNEKSIKLHQKLGFISTIQDDTSMLQFELHI